MVVTFGRGEGRCGREERQEWSLRRFEDMRAVACSGASLKPEDTLQSRVRRTAKARRRPHFGAWGEGEAADSE